MTRVSRGRLVPLFLLFAVVTCAPLAAQPLDRSGAGALTGTFVSADARAVVVRTDEETLVTFSVEDQVSVPAGLVPGMRVTVRYDAAADGRLRVVRVGVASYPPEPGSTTSLPVPPAAEPTPGPPAPSPSPPPARGAVPSATRSPEPRAAVRSIADRPAARRTSEAPPPVFEEPFSEPPAPAVASASAPENAPPSPSREPPPARDVLKLVGLLLMAGGLLTLAYAFVRGYA